MAAIETPRSDNADASTVKEALSEALGTSLTRVVSTGETLEAVIKILTRLDPKKPSTAFWALYILRVLDDPSILVGDVAELDAREEKARATKKRAEEIKTKLWTVLGLGITGLVSYLLSLFT